MYDPHLPFTQLKVKPATIGQPLYQVISQTESWLLRVNGIDKPELTFGVIVDVTATNLRTYKGVVLEGGNYPLVKVVENLPLSSSSTLSFTSCKKADWFTTGQTPSVRWDDQSILIPGAGTALLNVQCQVPDTHKASFIGWSLFYEPWPKDAIALEVTDIKSIARKGTNEFIKVASGNDRDSYGSCYIEGSGQWPAGIYLLRVKRHDPILGVAITSADKTWAPQIALSSLSSGGMADVSPPIVL